MPTAPVAFMFRALLTLLLLLACAVPPARAAGLAPQTGRPGTPEPRFVPVVEKAAPEDVRLDLRGHGWIQQYPETGMTFIEYVSSRPIRPTPQRHTIYLVPLGDFDDTASLRATAAFLSAYYMLPAKVAAPLAVPATLTTDSRYPGRYDADQVIFHLHANLPADAFFVVALTRQDLYSGRLSGVYGLGYADMRCCVVSTRRLWTRPERAGESAELFRLCKLAAHESGHVLGLSHCAAYACAMNGTTGLASIEQAPVELCGPCLRKIRWSIGFSTLERTRRLVTVCRSLRWNDALNEFEPRLARLEREERNATGALLAARPDED